MTIPHGKGWYRFDHADDPVRRTQAWEHETFAEEQARWERSDPEYARICENVRQAKRSGEEASVRADGAKAAWDARVATQRQANDDAEKALHASQADSRRYRFDRADQAVRQTDLFPAGDNVR
jgi:hypothetical protein